MRKLMMAVMMMLAGSASATPRDEIRLALQAGGTAAWEAAAMQELRLDEANGITLTIRDVADSKGGQIALQAGEVDVILSDFVWVSLQRQLGADFTFVPHSLAVGGLMAMPGTKVSSVADLAGATLAVAGGPVDKSYLILQAYFASLTGGDLTKAATVDFGAPPLVNEQLMGGRADAALNFWHFNARAAAAGAVQIISVQEMLKALGLSRTPPLLGWVFSEKLATNPALTHYLDASFQTKQALLTDDALWQTIRPRMNAETDAQFEALRDAYRAGIVTSYTEEDINAARQAFALLGQYGGADITGDQQGLAPGTFWDGYSK